MRPQVRFYPQSICIGRYLHKIKSCNKRISQIKSVNLKMISRRLISIVSLLLLALSVLGNSNTSNLRKEVSTDNKLDKVEMDANLHDDKEKRYLVST